MMRSPSLGLVLLLATIAIVAVLADGPAPAGVPPPPAECPEGQFASNGGCSTCPPFSHCRKGSRSVTDCKCWPRYNGPDGGACEPLDVDGGWCPVSECSATCGGGTQTRTCGCPAPKGNGATCAGEATVPCCATPCVDTTPTELPCPESTYSSNGMYIPGTSTCTPCPAFSFSPTGSDNITDCECWNHYTGPAGGPCVAVPPPCDGQWCPVSDCSVSCGTGTQTRICGCPAPSNGGADCVGASEVACSGPACEVNVNGGWCPLTNCSTTCGTGGVQTRTCACPPPQGSLGAQCEGDSTVACAAQPECVPDINGGWCPVTECSATCGGGTQTRTCGCPAPSGNGATCAGSSTLTCNSQECTVPVNGGWCDATACSASCGGGTQTRTCACPAPANGGAACEGSSELQCSSQSCPIVSVNGGWCPVTTCSVTCGGGTQTRTCACPPPQGDGTQCEGSSTLTCGTDTCPVELPCACGSYSSTGKYLPGTSTCTACPQYSSSREGSNSIDDCKCWSGYVKQSDGSCAPIEDIDGGWCPLSDCSASCGCGVRTRTCGCPSRSGRGKDCKGPSQVECVQEACVGTEVCPASTYSNTGSYIPGTSTCTACPEFSWSPAGSDNITDCTCWAGYTGPAGGPCTEVTPNVNGGWCPVSECSATCGGGTQTRTCACPPPQGTGATCTGSSVVECASCACETEGVPCAESTYSDTGKYVSGSNCTACPEYSWSPAGSDNIIDCECWSGYTGPAGGPCTQIIPSVNGGWCPLSTCNATCDGGFQERVCACPPRQGDGTDCEGSALVECNTDACVQSCPESHYSSTGTWDCRTEQRCRKCPKYSWAPAGSDSKRDCVCWAGYEGPNGGPCKPVNANVNGGWCPATECSATCGGGTQTRTCECPSPSGSGANCSGEATVSCNRCACSDAPDGALPCPESTYSNNGMYVPGQTECTACPESTWSPSGSDNITDCGCWAGYTGPDGGPCTEVVPNVNGGWCPYDSCNATCGGGVQYRTCACPPPEGDGAQCDGSAEAICNTNECPFTQPPNATCSDAADHEQCSGWEGCVALSGYDCNTRDWCAYLGCTEAAVVAQVQTCAVNTDTGARGWFPTSQLPAGFLTTTPMGGVRSCCAPRECNSTTAARDDNGCTYRVGEACAVLQFRGECPVDLTAQQAWVTAFFNEMAASLSAGLAGVDLGKLSDYVSIVSGPNPNNATGTYFTTIQIKPLDYVVTLPYSPEQVVAAIVNALQSGNMATTQVASQLQGVASFTQYTADGPVVAPAGTASAADGLHASIVLVLATGAVATLVAKVAAFMQ